MPRKLFIAIITVFLFSVLALIAYLIYVLNVAQNPPDIFTPKPKTQTIDQGELVTVSKDSGYSLVVAKLTNFSSQGNSYFAYLSFKGKAKKIMMSQDKINVLYSKNKTKDVFPDSKDVEFHTITTGADLTKLLEKLKGKEVIWHFELDNETNKNLIPENFLKCNSLNFEDGNQTFQNSCTPFSNSISAYDP